MQDYETRLINKSGGLSLLVAGSHFSDAAAIHAARQLCKDGEAIEIWRGDVCIFSEASRLDAALVQAVQSAKALL